MESSAYEGGESSSAVRSRRRFSEAATCPACGCTLRPGELRAHLALELDRLAKLSSGPSPKRRATTPNHHHHHGHGQQEAANRDATGQGGNAAPPASADVYERVKRNRERRLRASRVRNDSVACPVCSKRVPSDEAEDHVNACLRKSSRIDDDDESIDVEGDGERTEDDGFVSYEWCSQVRVRASALQLMDGGELPHGAMRIRRASTDTHLVVDGDDDDMMYGPSQYSPSRIESNELSNANFAAEDANGENSQPPDIPTSRIPSVPYDDERRDISPTCHNIIVDTLKSRIRELEQQIGNKNNRTEIKCLICIGPYNEPVVSVQCWHVYCEGCWLASLGAKKTCPQCNTITTTQHLRRIYL